MDEQNLYSCESCIFNPPSSGDGKPCCMCDPSDELLNCHIRRDDNSVEAPAIWKSDIDAADTIVPAEGGCE